MVIRAELRKLLALPTAWAGLAVGILLAPAIALVNARYTHHAIETGTLTDTSDLGLSELGIGLIGAMVLGVVVMSSEYTSTGDDAPGARQLTATLTATPRRLRLLGAKAAALTLIVAAQGAVTIAATLAVTHRLYGVAVPAPSRVAGALLYWVLTALLAYAITLITRTGIVPLTLLIVNSAVVSVSYLLTKVTSLAAYLPDIVGPQMFIRTGDFDTRIAPGGRRYGDDGLGALVARDRRRPVPAGGRVKTVDAELRKLLTLPSLLLTATLTWACTLLLAWLPGSDSIAALRYTQAGFLVLGALAGSSEYQAGGQIRTTLVAMPHRLALQAAKAVTLAGVTLPVAAVVTATSMLPAARWPGTIAYLTLTTLLAAAVAGIVRDAVPAVLVLLGLFYLAPPLLPHAYPPVLPELGHTAGWALTALTVAALTFHRRDA